MCTRGDRLGWRRCPLECSVVEFYLLRELILPGLLSEAHVVVKRAPPPDSCKHLQAPPFRGLGSIDEAFPSKALNICLAHPAWACDALFVFERLISWLLEDVSYLNHDLDDTSHPRV